MLLPRVQLLLLMLRQRRCVLLLRVLLLRLRCWLMRLTRLLQLLRARALLS